MNLKKAKCISLIVLMLLPSLVMAKRPLKRYTKNKKKTTNVVRIPRKNYQKTHLFKGKDDWTLLKHAICKVESNHRENARNGNCIGIMQLSPIYVKEVNKILGRRVYNLKDRYSKQKSFEMFEIYQAYYNPEKDLIQAIHSHNRRGGNRYINKVVKELNKLRLLNYNDTIMIDKSNLYYNDILAENNQPFFR